MSDHPVLDRLLGLTPVVALSDTLLKGVALCLLLATLLLASALLLAPFRELIPGQLRLVARVLVTSLVTTLLLLLLQAFAWPLAESLGIYLPLLAVSTLVLDPLEREEATSGVHPLLRLSSSVALLVLPLAALRELLGRGTLLDGLATLAPGLSGWTLHLGGVGYPLPLLATPAGGLLLLALAMALHGRLRAGRTGGEGVE
ncbi:MAG: electron transporter RnfE [Gammaproteobacteria bacterium]|nr:MAG: electron transporter RnfE [Gammaproteobacteria bacterium]